MPRKSLPPASCPVALRFQGEVDHHDGVLLDDADQQHDPDQSMTLSSLWKQQRQQRAHACRGQRRKNRDGMDVALVQHPENDVDGDQCREDQIGSLDSESLNAAAVPWKLPRPSAEPDARARHLSIACVACPSETPGARLNDSVTEGNWPWWFTASGVSMARNA